MLTMANFEKKMVFNLILEFIMGLPRLVLHSLDFVIGILHYQYNTVAECSGRVRWWCPVVECSAISAIIRTRQEVSRMRNFC